MPGEATEEASAELTWTVPKEWQEERPTSAMRKAQYRLAAAPGGREGGECVIYYFGAGQGGDIKSNLDRTMEANRARFDALLASVRSAR